MGMRALVAAMSCVRLLAVVLNGGLARPSGPQLTSRAGGDNTGPARLGVQPLACRLDMASSTGLTNWDG